MTPSRSDLRFFNWLVVLVHVLGGLSITFTALWMAIYRGGWAWAGDPGHEFNYHPLFMVIGMIVVYADAILVYRMLRNQRKLCTKVLHTSLHMCALVISCVGVKAVFDSHNLANPPIPNMYSLHSWLGGFVLVCFSLQWILGFTAFLWPQVGMTLRYWYMPWHTFWGVTLLVLTTACALMGITEKAFIHFLGKKDLHYSGLPGEGILINLLGVALVGFTGLVVYVVTQPAYRRQPLSYEEHVPLDGSNG